MSHKFIRIEEKQYIKLVKIAKKNKRTTQQQLAYLLETLLTKND